jgi:hypothetical protein
MCGFEIQPFSDFSVLETLPGLDPKVLEFGGLPSNELNNSSAKLEPII